MERFRKNDCQWAIARRRSRRHAAQLVWTAAITVVSLSLWPVSVAVAQRPEVAENSLGMKFVKIPAGEFEMGSADGDEREKPVHRVRITKPFFLGVTEVTQAQWQKVMNASPWKGEDDVKESAEVAASCVSWDDAEEFCSRLTKFERSAGRLRENQRYRLPTEAEWEYACRAGTKTQFSFGEDESRLSDHAWWGGMVGDGNAKTERYAHEVGRKKPNPWGLHDMHGNVWEWCSDWFDDYKTSPAADPRGPDAGSIRVTRGGGWLNSPVNCRAANRGGGPPAHRHPNVGFRVVLSVE